MAESDDCYPLKMSIRCELCNYKSNRKSNFDRHMKSMHEECDRPIQCCGQVFVNKASLKKHSHQFHKEGYRCDEKSCNKVFPRKALLRRHQTVHNGIKEFSCADCMYENRLGSNRKSNFDRHMKSMHEECDRPIQCCGQVFVNKASLKKHSHQFHKEGYRCDEKSCNKVFPRKALLRRHQTVHNGIKEFSCADCMYE
ncbi:unnamed protein product, partial [Medioppia subpectinata]